MKRWTCGFVGAVMALGILAGAAQAGTWQPVAKPAPFSASTALLLMNGNVMVQDVGNSKWWVLKPDRHGNYANGSWARIASMPPLNGAPYAPLYYASAVLPDGKVIVMGGEYNGGDESFTSLGALYDPELDSWTIVNPPSDSAGYWSNIGDSASVVLPNGQFMLQCGPCTAANNTELALFNESTLSWTVLPGTGMAENFQDEQGFTLLPDGSVLTIDVWNKTAPKHAERFYQNQWIGAGNTTAILSGGVNFCGTPSAPKYCRAYEIGPSVLRADGSVLAFGATGFNSIYHPPADPAQPGTWSAAASFPIFNPAPASNCWRGTPQFDVADGPAALLPSGNVLVAASPGVYCQPTRFYEVNARGTLTQVAETPNAKKLIAYEGRMLELPTGQILFTDQTSDVEIYTPTGTVNDAWRPNISKAPTVITRGVKYTVSGTQFNGMSQGAMYGDDAQMASNYPLVRVVSFRGGQTYYCGTTHPSTMGVATGNMPVSVQFTCGSDLSPGFYSLVVVANGISSSAKYVTIK